MLNNLCKFGHHTKSDDSTPDDLMAEKIVPNMKYLVGSVAQTTRKERGRAGFSSQTGGKKKSLPAWFRDEKAQRRFHAVVRQQK
ncbi:MAG: hypothetical protein KIS77_11300 [Saprospiraceae bacterium]|nr:hypothetical protein [Saprospiraceae bacterium]